MSIQDVFGDGQWQGWGRDNIMLCSSSQVSSTDALLCYPDYPGEMIATEQAWTGVVCTPNGTVLCLALPGWGLTGDVGALEELSPLQDMQFLNLANNSLSGDA